MWKQNQSLGGRGHPSASVKYEVTGFPKLIRRKDNFWSSTGSRIAQVALMAAFIRALSFVIIYIALHDYPYMSKPDGTSYEPCVNYLAHGNVSHFSRKDLKLLLRCEPIEFISACFIHVGIRGEIESNYWHTLANFSELMVDVFWLIDWMTGWLMDSHFGDVWCSWYFK